MSQGAVSGTGYPARPSAVARTVLAGSLLSVMAALLVLSSLHKKLAYDEYDNLSYGYQLLDRGPSAPPSGQRMPILVLNALTCRDVGCRREPLDCSEVRRLLVRAPTMLFALLLGGVVYGWAHELWGPAGGLLSLGTYVLNPNMLAQAKQITSDVQTCFFAALGLYAFWRLLRRPATGGFLVCAAATAGALVSKYTGLLLIPLYLILLGLDAARVRLRDGRLSRTFVWRRAGAAFVFGLLVLFLLNALYLFRGTLTRADAYDWKSHALEGLRTLPLPLPLPHVFVKGLDFSAYVQEHSGVARRNNYVLGRLNQAGTWYAFPVMLLLKTPLALFGLLFLAGRARLEPERAWDAAFLMIPFAVILAFFSLWVRPQLGIRYVLPGVIPLFVYAGRAASAPARKTLLVIGLVAWHSVSALSYHPHYMSYFNELIGPRVNAYRFLADSNLDWEDRSYDIALFSERHPETPLLIEPARPRAGHVLVGANQLVGIYDPERFRWLRENFEPIGHVGYSYLLFDVSPERLGNLKE